MLTFREATFVQRRFLSLEPLLGPLPSLDLTGIHWVIAGGESGPRYRMPDLSWIRDIRDRCVDQHVPFFFKQVGGPSPKAGGRLLDGRIWDQYPATMTAGRAGCRASARL
jgi:protein gp37